jgi:citrate lyase subunit beta/citryl-CoA lyase
MRSLLFVPAIRPRFVEKAPSSGADVICLDLEDSVPVAEKAGARHQAAAALESIPDGPYQVFLRVNGLETGLTEEELYAVVGPRLDGISLPKAETADHVRTVDAYLTLLEKARGIAPGSIGIIPWIETARGLQNAAAICEASPRLVGASPGGEDFTADMGIERTDEGRELDYPRQVVAVACRAAGITAIDTPLPDFSNPDKLVADARRARAVGYRAKWCIHPAQVETVNREFRPTEREIEWAQRVKAAFDEAEARGHGAVALDGAMIDIPVLKRALKVLESA